ncbi:MAG TPA: ABC transporter substrate-binding protein [Acidimicrobiales bacterium]
MRRSWRLTAARGLALVLGATVMVAACSSSAKTSSVGGSGTSGSSGGGAGLATGVTATTVKVGVALVDFSCIQQFVDQIRVNQDKVYQAYFDDVNAHGGIAGRQIVPDYRSYCPLTSAAALTLCTQFTEDDHVFAVMANFEDFSGDAQTCVARDHKTPLLTFDLTQAIMSQSPPGMIIFPGTNAERVDSILISLLQKQHTLAGKKIAILGQTTSQGAVTSTIEPALKRIGANQGSTAILSITGTDTSAAQAQLDSFIERWKSEKVNALYVAGLEVAAQQFIEKLRQQLPNVLLVVDINTVLTYAQEEQTTGHKPNPYEGMITAAGPTTVEYNRSANWKYCADIYQKETGKPAPDGEQVIPGPNGKTLDTYGSINDACQLVSVFHDIAARVGKNLTIPNWIHTVDTYGPIANRGGGQYASLRTGHYDIDDSFRLESYDSTIGAKGDWKSLTPLENVSGS